MSEFGRIRVHHRLCRPRVDANELCAKQEGGPRDTRLPAALRLGKRSSRERRSSSAVVVVAQSRSDAARMRWFSYSLQLPRPLCPRTGKGVGWSGECSGGRRHTNLAGWEASLEPGSFPILENRLRLQDILPLNMRATIPKRSLGRHVESRTASLPGGGREGEAIRAHPVTLPFLGRSSKC